jgi:hypothetical protein
MLLSASVYSTTELLTASMLGSELSSPHKIHYRDKERGASLDG